MKRTKFPRKMTLKKITIKTTEIKTRKKLMNENDVNGTLKYLNRVSGLLAIKMVDKKTGLYYIKMFKTSN